MRVVLFYSFLILYCSTTIAQTPKAVKLTDSLLKAGTFKVAITSYDFPEDIKTIQNKVLTNLRNDPEWAHKYIVHLVEEGAGDLKFLAAYGITRDEFEKMLVGFKKRKQAIYSDTSQISIKKNNGLITFHCSKKLSLFNFLKIDTKNSIIYFDNLKVTRELDIDGKFYAPILKGIESHMSKEISSRKLQSDIAGFGFTVGINQGNTKPTLCLSLNKRTDGVGAKPEFLIITIL